MLTHLCEPSPHLRPFPLYEDVFNEPLEFHRTHFLPLVSVNAAAIYPDLDLWLHFVAPIEPLLELDIGYFTEEFHDQYNRQGQFAFRLHSSRYAFTGHANYLAYESGAIFTAFPGQDAEIQADRQQRISTYEATRQRYQQTGKLCMTGRESAALPFVDQLGGAPRPGNWGTDPPRNSRGTAFRFIGEAKGFLYCEGSGFLLLYYDPEEEIALIRMDWT